MLAVMADQENERRFAFLTPPAAQSFTYRIHAGDALTEYFNIPVVPRPAVENIAVRYDFPSYAALPAGGRLAYSYPLVFAESVQARYVRFVFTPLEGRGLGISELGVFDEVTVEAWPGDVVLPEP